MKLIIFIAQILLFFLIFWIFKKKNIDFCKLTEKINDKIFIALTIILSVSLPFLYISEGHNWGGDFSTYIAQAQSILTGTMKEQVETNTFIVTNSNFQHGPGSYPWGFPLILAPVIKIFGVNYIALKCVNVLFLTLSILVFYKFLKEKIGLAYARFAVFFVVFNPYLLSFCDDVLSDIPFLFFSLVSLYFLDKLLSSEKKQIFYGIMTGLGCFAAYFVRTNGIVSLLTLTAAEFLLLILKIKPLRKLRAKFIYPKQKALSHILAYGVFALGAVMDKLLFPSGASDYGYYFKFLSKSSLVSNFEGYMSSSLNFFSVNMGKAFPILFILGILFIYSIKKEFFKETAVFIYIAGMFALVVIFPAYQGMRYIITILPLILMLCFKALSDFERDIIGEDKFRYFYRFASGALVCVIILTLGFNTLLHAKDAVKEGFDRSSNSSYSETAREAYDYITENTEEDDIVVFFKPRVMWLNTHRKSISVSEPNMEKLDEVDYVLLEKSMEDDVLKEYCEAEDNAQEVFSNDDFVLYSINE